MNKLQKKEVWVDVKKDTDYIVKRYSSVGCHHFADVEKQSGYFFTREELEALLKKTYTTGMEKVLYEFVAPDFKTYGFEPQPKSRTLPPIKAL